MTQPTKAAIRKACEEAGETQPDIIVNRINHCIEYGFPFDAYLRSILALARRIEAESAGVVEVTTLLADLHAAVFLAEEYTPQDRFEGFAARCSAYQAANAYLHSLQETANG